MRSSSLHFRILNIIVGRSQKSNYSEEVLSPKEMDHGYIAHNISEKEYDNDQEITSSSNGCVHKTNVRQKKSVTNYYNSKCKLLGT